MAVLTICVSSCFFLAVQAQEDLNQGRSLPDRNLLTHTHYTRFGTITGRIKYTDTNQMQGIGDSGRVPSNPGEYFFSFSGIPYATPPMGSRRLQEAEPVYSWHGDLDATRPKLGCPRAGRNSIGVTEDCLYLNVFTKNLIKTRTGQGSGRQQSVSLPLRPVIVFLPGFENEAGAGEFGGNRIMREDIVVVTVEYRVGLLGFLSDETKALPGNLGMVDVQLALGWVQQAIADFGGNPQSVTLAGYGQGAVIAHLLSLNPSTSNLFQKLILQSGSSLCDGSVSLPSYSGPDQPSPYYTYKKVLYSTECSDLKCLQDKPLQELLNAQAEIEEANVKITSLFNPVVDKETRRTPLVPTDPKTLDQSLISRSVPMMIGSSRDEGLSSAIAIYLKNQGHLSSPETFKKEVLPDLMVSLLGPVKGNREELKEATFRQYFAELSTGSLEDIVAALGEMLGDVLVNSCIRETILLHRQHSSSPIYTYLFTHAGGEVQPSLSRNLGRMSGLFSRQSGSFGGMGQWGGNVWRGDDLLYLWQMESQPDTTMRLEDKLVSQNLTTMWATFATSGSPQPYPRFSESLLQNQNQLQEEPDWSMVESRGPISYYNISLQQAGMFQDYRKTESVFWQYQMEYFEELSGVSATMKGYAASTWVLAAVFFIVFAVLGTGVYHFRKQHRRNEKALQGRDYNSWVSNMNNLKNSESNQNNYEVK